MLARSGIRPTYQNTSEIVPYVETANTSHSRGLRGCGHIHIEFGYGNSQYASQGRPRCRIGNMPAQATANNVIASENRLIDVRQSCFKRNRIAEISVPAWPIPIHHTKLMIANPQPIGMFTPQMPTPLKNSSPTASIRMLTKTKEKNAPISHFFGDLFHGW